MAATEDANVTMKEVGEIKEEEEQEENAPAIPDHMVDEALIDDQDAWFQQPIPVEPMTEPMRKYTVTEIEAIIENYIRTQYKIVKYQKTKKGAITPKRATPGSAGYDLYSTTHEVLYPGGGEGTKFPIGVRLLFDHPGMKASIVSRSGLAISKCIEVVGGVGTIDSDYSGTLCAVLRNVHPTKSFIISPGQRIAQVIIEPHHDAELIEATKEEIAEYDRQQEIEKKNMKRRFRGTGSFGSTGLTDFKQWKA